MGILDALFGQQQQPGQPPQQPPAQQPQQPQFQAPLGILGRISAHLAPDIYNIQQKRLEQQQTYEQAKNMGYDEAHARMLALNPGGFQDTQEKFQDIGTDLVGNPVKGFVNPAQHTVTPYSADQGLGGGPGTTTNPQAAVGAQPAPQPGATGMPPAGQPGQPGVPGQAGPTPTQPAAAQYPTTQQGLLDMVAQMHAQGKSPEDITAALPPQVRGAVEGLLEGRYDLRTLLGNRTSGLQKTLGLIASNMGLDQGVLEERKKFAGDLGNTKNGLGKALLAAPKVLNHLETGLNDFDQLWGAPGVRPQMNSPGNSLTGALEEGTGYIEKANANRNIQGPVAGIASKLGDEADTYSTERWNYMSPQNGGTMAERMGTKDLWSNNRPPAQTIGLLQGEYDLLKGQFQAHEDERDRAIGPNSTNPRFDVFPQKQKEQMDRIGKKLVELKAKYGYQDPKTGQSIPPQAQPAAAAPQAPSATAPGGGFKGLPGQEYSPSRNQYRDLKTGAIYDGNGKPVKK